MYNFLRHKLFQRSSTSILSSVYTFKLLSIVTHAHNKDNAIYINLVAIDAIKYEIVITRMPCNILQYRDCEVLTPKFFRLGPRCPLVAWVTQMYVHYATSWHAPYQPTINPTWNNVSSISISIGTSWLNACFTNGSY